MVADWQRPAGVSRGLWDYVHDPAIARGYDAALAATPLLEHDIAFVREHTCPPGRLIDLGCGTGRLSVAMAQAGFRTLAVDLSAEMLAIVGEKARAAGVAVDRLKANLVDLRGLADGSFDVAACLFQTLGMIDGAGSRENVVAHAYRLLKPGGVFLLHAHNRWSLAGTHHGRRLLLREIGRSVLGRQEAGDYVMPPHQGLGPMPMHLFTRREIVRLIVAAGFTIREVRPVAIDGPLRRQWWFGRLRAYGYLVAAVKT